jgi:hypothetical protein
MDRPGLIDRLNEATDRAASIALQRKSPMRISKSGVLIGGTSIEKNKQGTYDILTADKSVLYEDISVFDVALIVAQRYNDRDTGVIKKVILLERHFSKYHNDMVHYLHCMTTAKKKKDSERMAILEDKFQLAEQRARNIRDDISIFKRSK